MKQMMWSAAIGLFAATMLAAPGAAAQGQPTMPAAHALLRDMLPSHQMGLPGNGTVDIVEVEFDGCVMGLSAQNRFFMVSVDFRKAIIERGTYSIIIQRGATVFRNRQMVQPQHTSTIIIHYFPNEENKMLNVFRYMSQQCYAGGTTPFD